MAAPLPLHALFAQGVPDFAIGLRAIPPAAWLQGGEPDPSARKDAVFAAHPATVWGETDGSRPGQQEVLALVAAAAGAVDGRAGLPPLLRASRAVPDDLCLMEMRDGAWRLAAISLCSPTFFSAEEVVGKSLAQLHAPVPAFADRFLSRIERIFTGLRPGLILERRNWTLVNSEALFTPDPAPIRALIAGIAPEDAGGRLFIRSERQTLQRLPMTGGALFTIRVSVWPLDALMDDPGALAAFAGAWQGASDAFRGYKKLHLYDALVGAFLRASGEKASIRAARG
ncbi:MAG TPA: heme-dependent oxidative N-demethylase subunit alpha family protein [Caulobacteraceae bacterium]